MSRIFISHSSQNETEAVEIKDWIETNGWDGEVFLDLDPERGLVAGEKWVNALKEAVHRCEAVLPLISKEWIASKWCQSEVGSARLLGKQIIPIIIDNSDISALPADMTSEQIVDRNRDPNWEIRLKEGLKRANLDPKTFYFEEGRRPYPGLEALAEDDAAIFFGRDAQTVRGLDRIREIKSGGIGRLMIIIGASGAGKSSFLRAGLWPRLVRDDRNFLPIAVIRPELAVLNGKLGLYQALSSIACSNSSRKSNLIAKNFPTSKGDIGKYVLDHGLQVYIAGLCDASRVLLPNGELNAPPTAVLSVDQAEELFDPSGNNETDLFLDILTKALSEDQQLIVIFTIRSDSYPQVQTDPRLIKISQNEANLFNLVPMEQSNYRTVIESPAKLVTPKPLDIAPLLTEALLEDSKGADALPLLAFTLERLYDNYGKNGNLTLDDYIKINRLEGAIEAAVNDSYNKALKSKIVKDESEFEKTIKAAFIPNLADVNDSDQFIRRMAVLEKIPSHTHGIIGLLVDQHLLIKDRRGSDKGEQEIIEVAHEALLREWPLLRRLLEEEKDNIRAIGAVGRSAYNWKKNGRNHEYLDHKGERLNKATELSLRVDMEKRFGILEKEYLTAALNKQENDERNEKRKRHIIKVASFAAITFGVVAIILSIIAGISYFNANKEKKSAIVAKTEAEEKTNLARRSAYNVQLARVSDQWKHNTSKALDFLNDTNHAPIDLRDFTWGVLYRFSNKTKMILERPDDRFSFAQFASLAFSPDGKLLASGRIFINFWDVETGKKLITSKKLKHKYIKSITFSPDGKLLASAGLDGTIKIWDVITNQEVYTLTGHSGSVNTVVFSFDGKTLASASYDKQIKLWNTMTGKEINTLKGNSNVVSLVFSKDGKTLTSASNNTIKIWDTASGNEIKSLSNHKNLMVFSLSPDGQTLVTLGGNRNIELWNTATFRVRNILTGHGGNVRSVSFSSDGKIIASGDEDSAIKLWNASTGNELITLTGHDRGVNSIAFSPDGQTLASSGWDKTIRLWDTSTRQESATLNGHDEAVYSVAFFPNGRTIASASGDKTIRLWDVTTGKERKTFIKHIYGFEFVAISPDGQTLASASHDKTIKLWDMVTEKERAILTEHAENVWMLAFSPDGKILASASKDKNINIWDAYTGKYLKTLAGHTEGVRALAFSPDGQTIASAGADRTIKLWNIATGKEYNTLAGHKFGVSSVAFSPDGGTLASASGDKTIKLWDVATGIERTTLHGHDKLVWSVAFSPDGQTLASGSFDETIKLWDAKTGQARTTLIGHSDVVYSVVFSPDGKTLASTSWDNTVKLWRCDSRANWSGVRKSNVPK